MEPERRSLREALSGAAKRPAVSDEPALAEGHANDVRRESVLRYRGYVAKLRRMDDRELEQAFR